MHVNDLFQSIYNECRQKNRVLLLIFIIRILVEPENDENKEGFHYAFCWIHIIYNLSSFIDIVGEGRKYYRTIRKAMKLCIRAELYHTIFGFFFYLGFLTYSYSTLTIDKFPFGMKGLKVGLYALSSILLTGIASNRMVNHILKPKSNDVVKVLPVLYLSTLCYWFSFAVLCIIMMVIFKRLYSPNFWPSRKWRDFPQAIGSYKLFPFTASLLVVIVSFSFLFLPGMKFLIEGLYVLQGCYLFMCFIIVMIELFPEAFKYNIDCYNERVEELKKEEEEKKDKKKKKGDKMKQKTE